MPLSRLQILQGPCQVQFRGSTFYSRDNVVVALNLKEGPVVSDSLGLTGYRDDDVAATITFTPDGQVTNPLLAVLFPFIQTGLLPGTSLFGTTDAPLVIWTRDGSRHVFSRVAITQQSRFAASALHPPLGRVTFRALRPRGAAWSGSLATVTAAAYPGDPAYHVSDLITSPFCVRWLHGAFPNPFATEGGWTIETQVGLHEVSTDDLGITDLRFETIEVSARAVPVGPAPADLLNALGFQGTGAVRGGSRAAAGSDLYLNGTGLFARLTQAALVDVQPVRAGANVKRVGECTWKSTVTFTGGTPNPPLVLSTSPIP